MIELRALTGPDLGAVLDEVAGLRIAVFREWPYLYEGSMDYERDYMTSLANSASAIMVGAFDGRRLVGAATGSPLTDHAADFADALAGHPVDLADVFYCAESVLLPAYRGQGLGHRFFDAREDHARALGLGHSSFCSVIRPADHPARPADYRPLDAFWRKRGYQPVPGAVAHFDWTDLGDTARSRKPLQVWMRALTPATP